MSGDSNHYSQGRKENCNADALSRDSVLPSPSEGVAEGDVQVAVVSTGTMLDTDVVDLLKTKEQDDKPSNFDNEQCKDPNIMSIIDFLRDSVLPSEEKQAKRLALQGNQFVLVDNNVYYVAGAVEQAKEWGGQH